MAASVRRLSSDELDPTGAGDCFGATFVTCRLQGRSVEESLRYANAEWCAGGDRQRSDGRYLDVRSARHF